MALRYLCGALAILVMSGCGGGHAAERGSARLHLQGVGLSIEPPGGFEVDESDLATQSAVIFEQASETGERHMCGPMLVIARTSPNQTRVPASVVIDELFGSNAGRTGPAIFRELGDTLAVEIIKTGNAILHFVDGRAVSSICVEHHYNVVHNGRGYICALIDSRENYPNSAPLIEPFCASIRFD